MNFRKTEAEYFCAGSLKPPIDLKPLAKSVFRCRSFDQRRHPEPFFQNRSKRFSRAESAAGASQSTCIRDPLNARTTENVTGHRTIRMLGQCFGVVVRSRGLGGNLMAGLRSIVGGEIHEYTQMLEEARRHALDRLAYNATAMGANAILMMRFDSAEIGNTMSEIVAYGTAAIVEPAP